MLVLIGDLFQFASISFDPGILAFYRKTGAIQHEFTLIEKTIVPAAGLDLAPDRVT